MYGHPIPTFSIISFPNFISDRAWIGSLQVLFRTVLAHLPRKLTPLYGLKVFTHFHARAYSTAIEISSNRLISQYFTLGYSCWPSFRRWILQSLPLGLHNIIPCGELPYCGVPHVLANYSLPGDSTRCTLSIYMSKDAAVSKMFLESSSGVA